MEEQNLPADPDSWSNLITYSKIGEEAFRQAKNGREFDFNSIDNPYSMIIETLEQEEDIHVQNKSVHSVETLGDYINYLSSQGPWSENMLGLHGFKTEEDSLIDKLEEMEEHYNEITELDQNTLQNIQLESSYLNDFFNSVAEKY